MGIGLPSPAPALDLGGASAARGSSSAPPSQVLLKVQQIVGHGIGEYAPEVDSECTAAAQCLRWVPVSGLVDTAACMGDEYLKRHIEAVVALLTSSQAQGCVGEAAVGEGAWLVA